MAKGRALGKQAKSQRPSNKAANALGYAKRQSLKSKVLGPKISDVYEYQQEKVRRAKVKPLLEKDEVIGMGGRDSGSEDEEGAIGKRREVRPRLVGRTTMILGLERTRTRTLTVMKLSMRATRTALLVSASPTRSVQRALPYVVVLMPAE